MSTNQPAPPEIDRRKPKDPSAPRWPILPDALARRFAILLATALVAANLLVVALDTGSYTFNPERSTGRTIERLALIVPLIEAAAPNERAQIARLAEDRFARVEIADAPLVDDPDPEASERLRSTLLTLGYQPSDVRAGIVDGRTTVAGSSERWRAVQAEGGNPSRLALSVRVAGRAGGTGVAAAPDAPEDHGEWINILARPNGPPPAQSNLPNSLVLFASLVAVLSVGLLFIARLTRPLAALAAAARIAGQGNHFARLPETGARELRETARAFNEMQDRIARFDAERMRMLAAVGHDLRTPITSLRIRAEMLDDEEREPIVRTLDEMTVMADGLVAYARDQREAEAAVRVDLAALIERIATERGASVAHSDRIAIFGRPVALTRAIGNLVDNANRYAGTARLSLLRGEEAAIVRIDDDGPGIPEDALAAMFEPFVRGEASRSLETGGSGLGLSIALAIIRAHGGTISLSNRREGGLRAEISLPFSR